MAVTEFVPKIVNLSKVALPLEWYPHVALPPGMNVMWAPETIPHVELTTRAETSLADGLTEGYFSIALADRWSQWKQSPDKSWQFQGGNIILRVDLMIYISERYIAETFWDSLFQLVLIHELKHWVAYINVVSSLLPKALKMDADLRRLVLPDTAGRMPSISDKEYQAWFVTVDPVEDGTKFEILAGNYWTKIRTEQDRLIDSSSEYRRYSDNIYNLKTGHPERVIWPK